MKEFVTIKIFNNSIDLYMAKSFLESEGIVCLIKDETINQGSSYPANLLSGIKLQVDSNSFEHAVELLIKGGFAKKEDFQIPDDIERIGVILKRLKNLFTALIKMMKIKIEPRSA
jgi:hypothetical protein